MSCSIINLSRMACSSLLCMLLSVTILYGQQTPKSASTGDDILRISTELVQTGITVLDKQGRFVDGLRPEQVEVSVDGHPVPLAFFQRITAGTASEEKPLPPGATVRGRNIIFFIDDLHLSPDSVVRTRQTILDFVEKEMGPLDQVAIASASGQLGFLQQFTDLKAVLRAAVAKLNSRPYIVRDGEIISMTEYTALRIDQGDKDSLNYYAQVLLLETNSGASTAKQGLGPPGRGGARGKTPSGLTREAAERVVKERAEVLLKQAASITINTLSTLESLMRSSSQLPGRKLVFFISDGFYLNDRNTGYGDKLKQITDAATRAGVIIYTMDARGLVGLTDTNNNRTDPHGNLSRSNVGELSASQDPLTALASDTGGRALLNTGALSSAVTNALKETSNYYLLAWRPTLEDQKGGKFKRVEVSIAGRPDLTVRLPRGFLSRDAKPAAQSSDAKPAAAETDTQATATKSPEADIKAALTASAPKKDLPTQVSVSFVDVPKSGPVLTASTQIATDTLGYGADGKQPAAVDLVGVILNEQGKPAGSFKARLNINPLAEGRIATSPGVIYSSKVPLKPGLYQVRVAARDDKSGKVGSAARWIEIPDLSTRRLTLSSLLVGGQFVSSNHKEAAAAGDNASEQVQFSVDRRFAHGSHLNFLTFIYNAARSSGAGNAPELEAQIRISKDGQTIVTTPSRKLLIDAATDMARIPYGADIALQTLPLGRYVLEVTIRDHVAQTSATQSITFDIE